MNQKTPDEKAIQAYAADIEAVNKKHNMRIVPAARLEVEIIKEEKPSILV